MDKKTEIDKKQFEYKLRRRRGTKSIRLAIHSDGNFIITAPRWYPLYAIDAFIREKKEWILERLKKVDFDQLRFADKEGKKRYKENKEKARAIVESRIEFFNRYYDFSFNKISVRNQRTCWGSASQKGNLNFNYKIISLPDDLRDYVIVHELCHLEEFNHGENFWKLVSKTVPNFKELRKKLRKTKTS